jgi:hypothetical protein
MHKILPRTNALGIILPLLVVSNTTQAQELLESCVQLGRPKLIAGMCDFKPDPMYTTPIQTVNKVGCPSEILVEYIDPQTGAVATYAAGRSGSNMNSIQTCIRGVDRVRIKPGQAKALPVDGMNTKSTITDAVVSGGIDLSYVLCNPDGQSCYPNSGTLKTSGKNFIFLSMEFPINSYAKFELPRSPGPGEITEFYEVRSSRVDANEVTLQIDRHYSWHQRTKDSDATSVDNMRYEYTIKRISGGKCSFSVEASLTRKWTNILYGSNTTIRENPVFRYPVRTAKCKF